MNKYAKIALACLPLLAAKARAHALWAEPAEGGYKIYFGEPGEALHEKKEKFAEVGPIKAWDAAGKEVKGTQPEDLPAPFGFPSRHRLPDVAEPHPSHWQAGLTPPRANLTACMRTCSASAGSRG